MYLVSFIVPVYNLNKEELDYCIKSIAQQSVHDYEVIIVDDGSNDVIARYCDELALQYGFRVIHQDNSGLAVARNTGMAAAEGKWIVHVDGDDWISSDLVESIQDVDDSNTDVIVWGYYYCNKGCQLHYLLDCKSRFNNDIEHIRESILCAILGCDNSYASLALNTSWGKAYSRSFINEKKLYYDNKLRRAQDAVYNLYVFSEVRKVKYIDKALSFYRADNISLSRGYNPKTFDYLTFTAKAVIDFSEMKKPSPRVAKGVDVFIMRCFRIINNQFFQHPDNRASYKERKRMFMNAINSYPYKDAFSHHVYRNGLLNHISDFLYIHRCFALIPLYDKLRDRLRNVKNNLLVFHS